MKIIKRIFLFMLILSMFSCFTTAAYMKVRANVPGMPVIKSDVVLKEDSVIVNEPIVVDIYAENVGNKDCMLFSYVNFSGDVKKVFISELKALDSVNRSFALGHISSFGKHKVEVILAYDDLLEEEVFFNRTYDISVRSKEPEYTDKILIFAKPVLERGQVNNIMLSINNEMGSSLSDIFIYSGEDNTASTYVERLNDAGYINYEIFVPYLSKKSLSVPIFLYDKKNDIFSQTILDFEIKDPSSVLDMSFDKEGLNVKNIGHNIAYLNIKTESYNNIFSLKPYNISSYNISLFSSDEYYHELEKSGKVNALVYSLDGNELYKNSYLDKDLIYYILGVSFIALVIYLIFFFLKSKKKS